VPAAAVVLYVDIVAGAICASDDRVGCHLDSVACRTPCVLFGPIGHRRRPFFALARLCAWRAGRYRPRSLEWPSRRPSCSGCSRLKKPRTSLRS
jgi:hypothetical protein